jgi:pimeloyl-ACP methyl ester carboxylesterase
VAGCGGGSGPEASSSPTAKATATAARSASRNVTISLDDRAGIGKSGPPTRSPRPVSALVADLDAFLAAADVRPPYLLVGQSMGGNVVLMYAHSHPGKVAGFVSMNPVPPAETWIKAAKKVMTKSELADERTFYRGGNDEHTTFLEPTLDHALPARIPYAVMFDEDCGGDTGFCGRILGPLRRTTRSLAAVGDGGRFVHAKGAGHAIFQSNPDLVQETINDVLSSTN